MSTERFSHQPPNEKPELPPPKCLPSSSNESTPSQQDRILPSVIEELIRDIQSGAILEAWSTLPVFQRLRVAIMVKTLLSAFESSNVRSSKIFSENEYADPMNPHYPRASWWPETKLQEGHTIYVHGEIGTVVYKGWRGEEGVLKREPPFRIFGDERDCEFTLIETDIGTIIPTVSVDDVHDASPLYPLVLEQDRLASNLDELVRRIQDEGGPNSEVR